MATDKKSFILYADLIHTVSKLPNEKAGELFKYILDYVNDKDPRTDDLILQISFEPIKQQLKRDLKRWEGELSKKSEGGALGNLKRWNVDLYNKVVSKEIDLQEAINIASNRTRSHTDTLQSHTIASVAVNDNVNVTVNDNANEDKEDRQGEFSEPSIIFTSSTIELGKEKKVAPKKETFDFKNALLFFVNDEQVVNDYMEVRKKKKGANTETAFNLLMDKINESNMLPIDCIKKCIERNWLSFDIEWLNNSNNNKQQNNGKPQKVAGIDIETLKRNRATIEEFKRKGQDSGNNDW